MPQPQQQGTGFINLQKILQANQGAGSQLAGAINTGVTGAAGQAQSQLGQAQQQFGTGLTQEGQTEQGQASAAQDVLNKAATGTSTDATTQPLLSDQDLSTYQSFGQENYGGPTGLSNLSGVKGAATNAAALGGLTTSTGGQAQLLGQFAGSNSTPYTAGEQSLDQALLGTAGTGSLAKSRQATANLPQAVDTAQNVAAQQSQAQAAALKQMQGNLSSQATQAYNAMGTPTTAAQAGTGTIGAETAAALAQNQAQTQNAANYQTDVQALMSGTATADQKAELQAMMGTDNYNQMATLAPYVSGGSAGLNATGLEPASLLASYQLGTPVGYAPGDVMSQQQLAQQNALATLTGNAAVSGATTAGAGTGGGWQAVTAANPSNLTAPQYQAAQIASNINSSILGSAAQPVYAALHVGMGNIVTTPQAQADYINSALSGAIKFQSGQALTTQEQNAFSSLMPLIDGNKGGTNTLPGRIAELALPGIIAELQTLAQDQNIEANLYNNLGFSSINPMNSPATPKGPSGGQLR